MLRGQNKKKEEIVKTTLVCRRKKRKEKKDSRYFQNIKSNHDEKINNNKYLGKEKIGERKDWERKVKEGGGDESEI